MNHSYHGHLDNVPSFVTFLCGVQKTWLWRSKELSQISITDVDPTAAFLLLVLRPISIDRHDRQLVQLLQSRAPPVSVRT